MNYNKWPRALGLAAVMVTGLLLSLPACGNKAPRRVLMVHCGNSMRPAAEEIAKEFERTTGIKVNFNFGGAETLFPAIVLSKKGDIFVCHDPFGDKLRPEKLLEDTVTVGALVPVIVVAKGNPLKLSALADLAKPEVRVGLMDPRYSTCGEILVNMLREKGLYEAVQKNVRVEIRNHSDLAAGIRTGHLDAAVVWNFISFLYPDVERVVTGDQFPVTNVTVCLLSCAEDKEAARLFLKTAGSEFGLKVFTAKGYAK